MRGMLVRARVKQCRSSGDRSLLQHHTGGWDQNGDCYATTAEQALPNDLLCLIMDILAPNEQCRMSLANKALRQHFVATGLLAALDKALAARDAVNKELVSDTWQWGIAVRRQPVRPDSFRKDFDKLYGHVSICTAFKSIYRFHLVMNDKVQCPAESR